MKVLLVSTFKNYGGAATCTNRLVNAFEKNKIQVEQLYVLEEKKSFGSGILKSFIERKTFWMYFIYERLLILFSLKKRSDLYQYSTGKGAIDLTKHPSVLDADILHLHWINFSFLSVGQIEKLSRLKPVVWTMHDMWPFTGGCHYAYDCKNYKTNCQDCQYLSAMRLISSSGTLASKQEHWKKSDFTLIGVSKWLSSLAKESLLFKDKRVETINNPIDINQFQPPNEHNERQSFNVLFGAVEVSDGRKGFSFLLEAIRILEKNIDNLELTVFGNMSLDSFQGVNCKINILGRVSGEKKMVETYQDADVFILPSIQETLSYTTMEAMACGTPVVAFNCGGVTDLVIHKETGYLAENRNVNDLVDGIRYYTDKEKSIAISTQARQHVVENFSDNLIAEKHVSLYEELIDNFENRLNE